MRQNPHAAKEEVKVKNLPGTRRIIKILGWITFAAGGLLGAYGLMDSYFLRKSLPEGACPVDQNRPLMWVALTLLALTVILSFAEDILKKKEVGKKEM